MQRVKRRRKSKIRKRRTKNTIKYHGRSGHPVIHAATNGRRYIMVRKRGGGVKRLYEGTKYREDGKTKVLKLK